jgi:bidirectional [NiFe] hydrogenase diaphorase subunit
MYHAQRKGAGTMSKVLTFKINGEDLTGREDQTILEVAREHKIYIPTLCYMDGLSILGGCRLCLVEIKGSNRLFPACATYIAENMEVQTDSPTLAEYRRMIIEMLFVEGNHVCSVCVTNGRCDLQSLALRLGVDHIRMNYRYPECEIDATHPRFIYDQNRCVLCTRCVRVCDEIEGAHTWDVKGRGIQSQVITDLDQPWGESLTCTGCSKCVNICPTGALFEKGKAVGEMTKRRGFLAHLTHMREGKK